MQRIGVFKGRPDDNRYILDCVRSLRKHGAEHIYCIGNAIGSDATAYETLRSNGVHLLRGASETAYQRAHRLPLSKGTDLRISALPSECFTGALHLSYDGLVSPYGRLDSDGRLAEGAPPVGTMDAFDALAARGVPLDRDGIAMRYQLLMKHHPEFTTLVMGQGSLSGAWDLERSEQMTNTQPLPLGGNARLLINIGDEPAVHRIDNFFTSNEL